MLHGALPSGVSQGKALKSKFTIKDRAKRSRARKALPAPRKWFNRNFMMPIWYQAYLGVFVFNIAFKTLSIFCFLLGNIAFAKKSPEGFGISRARCVA